MIRPSRREGGYDWVVSALALNFFPDPELALAEQAKCARPGGVLAASVWDYAEGMEFLRRFWDSAIAVVPEAAELDEGRRFPICRPEPLKSLFVRAGLEDVDLFEIGMPTRFANFEDYWRPFLGGTGPAPSLVRGLTERRRTALANELRSRLPVQPGGRIDLRARAWVAAARKPREAVG